MKCEICNKFDAIYNIQIRPLQEPEEGSPIRGKAGRPSLGDVYINVQTCETCTPFRKALEVTRVETREVKTIRSIPKRVL